LGGTGDPSRDGLVRIWYDEVEMTLEEIKSLVESDRVRLEDIGRYL